MRDPAATRVEQLRETFRAELDDHIRSFNQLLRRLEREQSEDGRAVVLDVLFREAHSLKAAAICVELHPVERLADALQRAFDSARRARTHPTATWVDAVYRGIDALAPLYRSSADSTTLADDATSEASQLLETLDGLEAVTHGAISVAPGERQTGAPGRAPARAGRRRATRLPSTSPDIGVDQNPPLPEVAAGARPTHGSVRVPVSKLDALLHRTGSVAASRSGLDRRFAELQDVYREMQAMRREWRRGQAAARAAARSGTNEGETLGPPDLRSLVKILADAERRASAAVDRLGEVTRTLGDDADQLGQEIDALRDEVASVRRLPITSIFTALDRVVRDVARQSQKQVRLVLDNGNVEIDRAILERLREPLIHLLRNAVDHGIERPEVRRALGKPIPGTVRISVGEDETSLQISVEDDGNGIDPERLRRAASARGLLSTEAALALDDASAVSLIFQPGFTTASTLTTRSGRGVGMDAVSDAVENLNGEVRVTSSRGQGARIVITVPVGA